MPRKAAGSARASSAGYDEVPLPPPEPKLPLRVLFIHGLESKAWGAKSTVLKKRVAETVQSIQMPVAELRKPWGRNFAMSAFAALVMLFIAGILAGTFALVAPTKQVMSDTAKAVCVAAGFAVSAVCAPLSLLALQSAMRFLVEECYAMQVEELQRFKPDVIVASSFGGAITQLLLARGAWSGPTLLLAPAGEKVMQWYNVAKHALMCTVCCGAPDVKAPPLDPDVDSDEEDSPPHMRDALNRLKAAKMTAEAKAHTVSTSIVLPEYSSTLPAGSAPPRILLIHAVSDAVVPLSHSLAWAAAPHSAAQVHVVAVLNDTHPLRHAASAGNLRRWLQALLKDGAAHGRSGDGGGAWPHGLPHTMLADVPDDTAGADEASAPLQRRQQQPWAQRFAEAAQS